MPPTARGGEPIAITGLAQVGVSGLAKVQYWLHATEAPLPPDPHFERADRRDADVLPPPDRWGGGLPDGRLPGTPLQFDPATGTPSQWPLRYTFAHWTAVLRGVAPGRYDLRCRSIDPNGSAQPMPRPFAKSGRVEIQRVRLVVES